MHMGITIPFGPFQNQHLRELVEAADRLGYTDAWSAESFGIDAFSPLAAAAMVSDRMRLGTAIVPVLTRPPALIAMCAATVQQLSNGRLVLGLGISTPNIMEGWMGVPFVRPVTRLKETVEVLRAIFRGEKVTYAGKCITINGFRLDVPLEKPPQIYLGAQGSKMMRLAGEIGDGVVTNFVTPETLPPLLDHARDGMRAAGKDPASLDVVCRIVVAVDEDEGAVRTMLRRSLTVYLTVPQYNKFFHEIGYGDEAASTMDAWKAGDRKKALASVPEEMLEKIYVFGSADQCRRRLAEYGEAGVTTTALQFASFAPSPEEQRSRIIAAMEKLAPA